MGDTSFELPRALLLLTFLFPISIQAQDQDTAPFQFRAGIALGTGWSSFTQAQPSLSRRATIAAPASMGVAADIGARYSHFFFEFSVFWLNNTFEPDVISPQLFPFLGLDPGLTTGFTWETHTGNISLSLGLEKGIYSTQPSVDPSQTLRWGGTAFKLGTEFEWNRALFSQSWLRPGIKLEYRYLWIRTDQGGNLPPSVHAHAQIYWAGLSLNFWDQN